MQAAAARILILYCEEGDGHGSAARTLAEDLEAAGAETIVHDAMKRGLGRLIPLISRDTYRLQVRWLRWSYGLEFFFFTRFPPTRAIGRSGLALFGGRPLLRVVREAAPTLVVSTHPAVTNILGHLRRRGRLDVPVVATITDFGVHRLWSHPAVDLHLVMHEASIPFVERFCGPGSARAVDALVSGRFRSAPEQVAARRALDLPVDVPVVLVSGGGWGVGDVARAVDAALAVPAAHVVCLSGRSAVLKRRLEERFAGAERLRIVPFTERMTEIVAAADVLVDSSLGVTSLEALTVGRPVVAFGAPPGHSRDNGRALGALGLAETPGTKQQLTESLARLVAQKRSFAGLPATGTTAAAAVLAAGIRAIAPARRRRRPALVGATGVLAVLLFGGWAFASPTPYPLIERTLGLAAVQRVPTQQPEVAVLVRSPPAQIPQVATRLAIAGIHATFIVSSLPSVAVRTSVSRQGDSLIATAAPTGIGAALRFRTQLVDVARPLRPSGHFYFLPPAGFTLADYVAVRVAGGYPVSPSVELERSARASVEPGMIVLIDADSPRGLSLSRAISLLAETGLSGVSLDTLIASSLTRSSGVEPASRSAPPPTASSDTTRPSTRQGSDGHHSWATAGASATGTNVIRANTIGATWATRRCRSADISLSVPIAAAAFIETNQKRNPSHACPA